MVEKAYVSFETNSKTIERNRGFNESCNRVYQGPNLKYTTIPIFPLMSLEDGMDIFLGSNSSNKE